MSCHLTPVSGCDKAGPVEGMRRLPGGAALAQRIEIGLMDCIYRGEPMNQARTIQLSHPIARRLIFHRPKAQDQRARSRYFKRATQAQHALPGLDFTDASIACGEHGPLDTAQIESGNFFGGENSVLFVGSGGLTMIRAREGQPRKQQRIFARRRNRRVATRLFAGSERGSALATEEESMRGQVQDALPLRLLLERTFAGRGAGQLNGVALRASECSAGTPPQCGDVTRFASRGGQGFKLHGLEAFARRAQAAVGRGRWSPMRKSWRRFLRFVFLLTQRGEQAGFLERRRPNREQAHALFFLLPDRHEIAFGREVVDARPGLEQVARLSGGKRREIHQVERAIRHDEHAPRVAEIWTHRTPYGAAERFAHLAIVGFGPLCRASWGPRLLRNLPAHLGDESLDGRRRTEWHDDRLCLRVAPHKCQVMWNWVWPLAAGLGGAEIVAPVADIGDEGGFRRKRRGDVVETGLGPGQLCAEGLASLGECALGALLLLPSFVENFVIALGRVVTWAAYDEAREPLASRSECLREQGHLRIGRGGNGAMAGRHLVEDERARPHNGAPHVARCFLCRRFLDRQGQRQVKAGSSFSCIGQRLTLRECGRDELPIAAADFIGAQSERESVVRFAGHCSYLR